MCQYGNLVIMKTTYRKRCLSDECIPLFQKDCWLDITAGDENWDVVVVEKNRECFASFVYYMIHKDNKKIITMPRLTQNMGLYISYPANQKYESKLAYEKKMMNKIISKMPNFDSFVQNFHYSVTNWLPFFWAGFQQTTRYTYVIEDTKDIDEMWKNLNNNTRTDIRKAQKYVKVVNSNDIKAFYELNNKTFIRQGIKNSSSFEFVEKLDMDCQKRNCKKILMAIDSDGNVHSAGYFVWDEQSVYYLMGGIDPNFTKSASMSLVIWEGIKLASSMGKKFDFEGSVVESIEAFFRGFGAIQKPYFQLRR